MKESVRDRRQRPRISTGTTWAAAIIMTLGRMGSLHSLLQTSGNPFWKRWLGRNLPSEDTIGKVFSKICCDDLRNHLAIFYSRMKRNKALRPRVGGRFALVLDGHESSASFLRCCPGCLQRRLRTAKGERIQYYHRNVTALLLCKDFPVLLDVELQQHGENEIGTAIRLLKRLLNRYPRAFDVIVADGLYTSTEFFRLALDHHKDVIAVLKQNRPELLQDALGLFSRSKPSIVNTADNAIHEYWDQDFSSWTQLGSVRVVRSVETTTVRRQSSGKLEERKSEWIWVATIPRDQLGTVDFVQLGHARWVIENNELNELVTYWHADHVYKHDPQAIAAFWLLTMLAYNLFHAFLSLNIKPSIRRKFTTIHWARVIASDLYLPAPITSSA